MLHGDTVICHLSFGKNGSFLSNMQVRNGLSIHNPDLTSQPVSFLTNFLNGETNFLNGDNSKGAKLRQYKEHLCVPHPDSLVDSVLSRLLPSSCLPCPGCLSDSWGSSRLTPSSPRDHCKPHAYLHIPPGILFSLQISWDSKAGPVPPAAPPRPFPVDAEPCRC